MFTQKWQSPEKKSYIRRVLYGGNFFPMILSRKEMRSIRATLRNTRVLCAQGAHSNYDRHDRKDWHTNSMPLPKELDPDECKNIILNLNWTDTETNQKSYNGHYNYFERLLFQVASEKKRTHYIVT